MKVVIVNKASYPREVQYYRESRWVVVDPKSSIEVEITSPDALSYYEMLNAKGFSVTVVVSPEPQDHTSESADPSEDIYSKYTDQDLKRIVTVGLGISTRITKRYKLINLIEENAPKGVDLDHYL